MIYTGHLTTNVMSSLLSNMFKIFQKSIPFTINKYHSIQVTMSFNLSQYHEYKPIYITPNTNLSKYHLLKLFLRSRTLKLKLHGILSQ